MASKRQQKAFSAKVGDALSVCQLVEEGLKLYLDVSFTSIRRELKGRIPFNFTIDDYREAPMERLLQVFRRLTDNAGLVRKLEAFKKTRNHLAHRAVAEYFERHESEPKKHLTMMKRLRALEDDGYDLWAQISVELRRVRGKKEANQSPEPTPGLRPVVAHL